MVNRNQDCPWRVVLSDQDNRAVDRLLEQTSKLVLSFGRCVGSRSSPAVLVLRDLTLPLRRKYLLGCLMILHDGILAIMAKMLNRAWSSLRAAGETLRVGVRL